MISVWILNPVLQNEWAWCVFIVEEGASVFIIKDRNLSLVFFAAKKKVTCRLQKNDFFEQDFFLS